MDKTQTFFLVRHGSLCLPEKTYLGQTDLPLSAKGLNQAKRLGAWLSSYPRGFRRIYVSPLRRCIQTLSGILDGAFSCAGFDYDNIFGLCDKHDFVIHRENDLTEINLGRWDGRSVAEIKQLYPVEYEKRGRMLFTYRTPGGESFQDLRSRSVSCFSRIASNTGNALIIAHAGVNRMILQYCLNREEFQVEACVFEQELQEPPFKSSQPLHDLPPPIVFASVDFDPSIDFMQIPQPAASCYLIRKI